MLLTDLMPYCEPDRLTIAGSVRRMKAEVGDVEILFVPRVGTVTGEGEMFGTPSNLAESEINRLVKTGILAQRRNALGNTTWGSLIKLAVHSKSGIPVDLFTATKENWWNYLVCRTGPAESNMAIAKAARARGLKWEPYSSGFVVGANDGLDRLLVESEADVFEFVGLKYQEPEKR